MDQSAEIERFKEIAEHAKKLAEHEKSLREEEQRRREEEQRLREEEQRLRKEEQRRREEEQRRREEEQRRREEAELRTQKAEEEKEIIKQNAEEEKEIIKQNAEEEKEIIKQNAELLTRLTTFQEYISACHEHLHKALVVETNLKWVAKGGFTTIKNKYYPKQLLPWVDFPVLQKKYFDRVYQYFHPPNQSSQRIFEPLNSLIWRGQEFRQRKMANEADLRVYERVSVEDMVSKIINHLHGNDLARDSFGLGSEISFENLEPSALDRNASEVQEALYITPPNRLHSSIISSTPDSGSDATPKSNPKAAKTTADQYCVTTTAGGIRKTLFLVEYKPLHKLSIDNLRAGFKEMDVEALLMEATVPRQRGAKETATEAETKARLQNHAETLVATVATQVFHYMILGGLEFSYITTGEAFIFFRIKEDDSSTLYYHLAVPSDINDQDIDTLLPLTAISHVLSLCLMAFQSTQRTQFWRRNAKNGLKRFKIEVEAVLAQIPETDRKLSPVSSSYKGRSELTFIKSPYFTRQNSRKKKEGNEKPRSRTACSTDNEDSVYDDDNDDEGPETPTKCRGSRSSLTGQPKNQGNAKSKRKAREAEQPRNEKVRKRQYCTQDCLLGVVRGLPVDEKCPNMLLHRQDNNRHAINLPEFVELVRNQLGDDLDTDCEPLGLQGARGALFKITLSSHGYVFVAKGTVRAFIPCLLHEGRVYERLANLQGTAVPVYLGNISLKHGYQLDLRVKIKHMLFMSWGGQMVNGNVDYVKRQQTLNEVWDEGVDQGDIRLANMLWNDEKNRVMLIDFERATFINNAETATSAAITTTIAATSPVIVLAREVRALQERSPPNKRQKSVHGERQDSKLHHEQEQLVPELDSSFAR